LVNKEGETGRACADGACADGACADGACADGACADKAYMDGAYADEPCYCCNCLTTLYNSLISSFCS